MTVIGFPSPEQRFTSPFAHHVLLPNEELAVRQPRTIDFAAHALSGPSADDVREAHSKIQRRMLEIMREPVAHAALLAVDQDDIVGVGFGRTADRGEDVLNVYAGKGATSAGVRARLRSRYGLSEAQLRSLPINIVRSGAFRAQANSSAFRPAPNGVSVGRPASETGTSGLLTVGRTAPRDQRLLLLSCNHVLANCNAGAFGDLITQPGPLDHGASPANDIGKLERMVTIDWGNTNVVDAATAWVDPDKVTREVVWTDNGGAQRSVSLARSVKPAAKDMRVAKAGRTTERTDGIVTDVGFGGTVRMPNGTTAHFSDQIVVVGTNGAFSQAGDSGAVVWEVSGDADTLGDVSPIGLVIAGADSGPSLVSKLGYALDLLDVSIY